VSGAPEVLVFDLRSEPCELAPRRWSQHLQRDPQAMRGVVLHQWGTEVGTTAENRNRYGEAEALARRALRAPYNVSCGVTRGGVGVVVLAHPLERYTFASDAANKEYLSVGVMGRFPFEAESFNPAKHSTRSAALVAAIDAAMAQAVMLLSLPHVGTGAEAVGPWSLITHRQAVNGKHDHDACAGEAVVAAALRSRPVADGHLVPDPDLVLVPGCGERWPEAWRRHLQIGAATPERRDDLCADRLGLVAGGDRDASPLG